MSMPALKPLPAKVYPFPLRLMVSRHTRRPRMAWLKSNWFTATLILFTVAALFQSAQISRLRADTDELRSRVSALTAESESVAERYAAVLEGRH